MRKLDVVVALLAGGFLLGCESPPPPADAEPADAAIDEQYVAALSAVDAFCHAWKQRDQRAARRLLSSRFLRTYTDAQIADAIVGQQNPAHAAYEIGSGRRVAQGRYAFDVRLFFTFAGEHEDRIEPERHDVVVVRDEQGNWKIDRFPVPSPPPLGAAAPLVAPPE